MAQSYSMLNSDTRVGVELRILQETFLSNLLRIEAVSSGCAFVRRHLVVIDEICQPLLRYRKSCNRNGLSIFKVHGENSNH